MRWDFLRPSWLFSSIPRVLAVYAGVYAGCVIAVDLSEAWDLADALWFGLVTITTTGYGDLSPQSIWGRTAAVVLMITSWVLNIVLAGQVAAKLIVDSDAFTHDEQEEIKRLLREIRARVN